MNVNSDILEFHPAARLLQIRTRERYSEQREIVKNVT